jgi:hypothetical protein
MSLQAAIEANLPFLRAEALARMTSRATVYRKTGEMIPGADGLEVPEWEIIHTDIPFRLGGSERGGAGTRTESVAGVETQVATRVGHFPFDTADLADGDYIDVTAGENAGAVVSIIEADAQDQATARRVPVVAEQRPAEWL